MNNAKIKVAILDTNVLKTHPMLVDAHIETKNILNLKNIDEDCGHGTAVCAIIHKVCANTEITVFPIFKNSTDTIGIDRLEKALEWILDNDIVYDIINLSNGVVELESPKKLLELCSKLAQKGTMIVSAYDNSGIMTYPACFPNVIGVDTSYKIRYVKDYEFIENSPVNIRGYARQQRVAWHKPNTILSIGSSFIAPHITGIICNILLEGKCGYKSVMAELKARSTNSIKMSSPARIYNKLNIRKAITFPFNKEIHSVVKFYDELSFDLKGVFDYKYSMRIGRKASDVLDQHLSKEYIIQSIDNVNWEEDFDTVIIGHLDEILNMAGAQFLDQLLENIIKHNKNIYSFDDYIFKKYFKKNNKNSTKCFFPSINKKNIPVNLFGKMWVNTIPLLGIYGTRSQQGKFTLQLLIKKYLMQLGYKAGHIASEPTGWLFKANGVFPFGYSNTININYNEAILTLNNMIHNIERKETDIIIAGCQSGTVPFDYYSAQRIMLAQTAFLYGTLPDAVFLCVCPDDDINYIKRTIQYIEASVDTTVLGLFLFPVITELKAGAILSNANIEGSDQLKSIADNFNKIFKIPVTTMNEEGVEEQVNNLLNFFS